MPILGGAQPRVWTPSTARSADFSATRKANASLLLQGVKELMYKDYELRDGFEVDKYVYSRPAADDIIDDLVAKCDFVVTCIAD